MPDSLSRKSYSLDIETTGLNPEEQQITTIGLCENSEGAEAEMRFVYNPEDEEECLRWLADRVDELGIETIVTWRSFDCGFIKERADLLGVPDPLEEMERFDLHRWVKENKYEGEEVHLKSVLSDYGLEGKYLPGRLMPILYDSYIQYEKEEYKRDIVKHCKRDVEALPEVIAQFLDELLE